MNPTTTFCWWNSLYSMTTGSILKTTQVITGYGDSNAMLTVVFGLVQSAKAIKHTGICLCQVVDKELAVFSAFGRFDFKCAFH
jgi:hypothetical protein